MELTKRQQEVYNLIIEGFSNAEIAGIINRTEKNVKDLNTQIFKTKFVTDRSRLIVKHYKQLLQEADTSNYKKDGSNART